eukprot:GHVS01082694.1.p1 GENE.GHVS01082694.1~~GHVS01082694.1.p1  ORF type:complete len:268 (-),score=80.17 GHVS01082694.1:570-1373(-)
MGLPYPCRMLQGCLFFSSSSCPLPPPLSPPPRSASSCGPSLRRPPPPLPLHVKTKRSFQYPMRPVYYRPTASPPDGASGGGVGHLELEAETNVSSSPRFSCSPFPAAPKASTLLLPVLQKFPSSPSGDRFADFSDKSFLQRLRSRLSFRVQNYGVVECEIVLGGFLRRHMKQLLADELCQLERLLAFEGVQLCEWLAGKAALEVQDCRQMMDGEQTNAAAVAATDPHTEAATTAAVVADEVLWYVWHQHPFLPDDFVSKLELRTSSS